MPEAALARAPTLPAPYRVARRRRETADTWTLELEPARDEAIRYAPGQFTMLYAFGVGEVPISISGDPARGGVLVQTVRAVGAVTRAVCASRPGTVLGLRGPYGSAWPVEQARGRDVLVVAGGIGLAPLRPILYSVLGDRAAYGAVSLLYGGRTPADLLYRRELERWRSRLDLDVHVTVDVGDAEWHGSVGVVTKLLPRTAADLAGCLAYLCGPEIMMRITAQTLLDAGVGPERIFLSMERNMRCAVAHCGHCQFGPTLICRDGAVYRYDEIGPLLEVREL